MQFKDKLFNITVIQVYAPTTNAEKAEVEWFYDDLQDLLELIQKRERERENVLFIVEDWNANVKSQEKPGVIGNFGLEVQNDAGLRQNFAKRMNW